MTKGYCWRFLCISFCHATDAGETKGCFKKGCICIPVLGIWFRSGIKKNSFLESREGSVCFCSFSFLLLLLLFYSLESGVFFCQSKESWLEEIGFTQNFKRKSG